MFAELEESHNTTQRSTRRLALGSTQPPIPEVMDGWMGGVDISYNSSHYFYKKKPFVLGYMHPKHPQMLLSYITHIPALVTRYSFPAGARCRLTDFMLRRGRAILSRLLTLLGPMTVLAHMGRRAPMNLPSGEKTSISGYMSCHSANSSPSTSAVSLLFDGCFVALSSANARLNASSMSSPAASALAIVENLRSL